MNIHSLLRGVAAIFLPLAACAASAPAPPAGPALYLVGEDWIGRWQDGAVVASAKRPGRAIEAVLPDGRDAVWLLTYPSDAASDEAAGRANIARYDAATLASTGPARPLDAAAAEVSALWPGAAAAQILIVRTGPNRAETAMVDAASLSAGKLSSPAWRSVPQEAVQPRIRAGRWLAPAPTLTAIDGDPAIDPATLLDAETLAPAPPAWLASGARILALSRDAALIMPGPGIVQAVSLADGSILGSRGVSARDPDDLRAALSPDGSSAIVFARPAAGDAWPGTAWDVRSGTPLPSRDLSIDSGAARELGQARSLACLLPHGAGAIFSLIGQPADRASEAILFQGATSRRVALATAYVRRCVIALRP